MKMTLRCPTYVAMMTEREHTNNPQIALEIAKDHLAEGDDYYDRLEDMEDKMEHGLQENISPKKEEPFGSYYDRISKLAEKADKKGYDWRKEAQIRQFNDKESQGHAKTLGKDVDISSYEEKITKPKKF